MGGKTSKNMFKRITYTLALILPIIFINISLFAQEESEDGDNRQSQRVSQRLAKEKEKPPEIIVKEGFEIEKPKISLPKKRILIEKITVVGATILSEEEIKEIILPYENKKLSLEEIQKVARLITDAYRKKGYITSGAHIPLQTFGKGVLEIRVIEGVTGEIKIEGNRYFKDSLLKKKITLKRGEAFNKNILEKDLYRMNKHPDRKAHVVLSPGKEPGVTNIVLKVKDRFPFHMMLVFDNYGHPNTEKKRYKTYFIFNNITGRDDKLSSKIQKGEAGTQSINDIDYVIPLTDNLKFEIYYLRKKEDYSKSRKDDELWKKAYKYIFLFTQSVIDEPACDFSVNWGFVYKNSFMWMLGESLLQDKLRAGMLGFDLSMFDKFGRTVIANDMEFGFPGYMGGLGNKDEDAFFLGGGGKYIKNRLTIARRNKLFSDLELLFKTQAQFSSHVLEGVDNFAIGGIGGVVDNRGYPRASVLGDSGNSVTVGLACPPYFLSKNLRVPFSKAKFYKALKFFIFYDWGEARVKSPEGEREGKKTIRSIGCGARLNLPEGFSLRVDLGWPLDFIPSDDDHFHPWVGISKDIHF